MNDAEAPKETDQDLKQSRTRIRRLALRDEIRKRTVETEAGCWLWLGRDSGTGRGGGYPRMEVRGHTCAVHRVAWVCEHGFLPSKVQLDHTCRNRRCVNPDHLEPVTHKQNQQRRRKPRT